MKKVTTFFIFIFFSFIVHAQTNFDYSPLATVPIQVDGRIKPLDTYARESLLLITGKSHYQKQLPIATLMHWIVFYQEWEKQPIILADHRELQEKLHLTTEQGHFISPYTLRHHQELMILVKSIDTKKETGERLSSLEQQALKVYDRLMRFYDIASGNSIHLFAQPNNQKWLSVLDVTQKYIPENLDKLDANNPEVKVTKDLRDLMLSMYHQDQENFVKSRDQFIVHLQALANTHQVVISTQKLNWEYRYNQLRPFRYAWIFYLLAALLLLIQGGMQKKWFYGLGWISMLLAFGFHVTGFVLRCYIAGRPPVSNMYESVLWVSLGVSVFAMVFESIYRARYYLLSGAMLACIGLVMADQLPAILDPSIHPLVPVLRSNYWLTVHVLTITLSYAAMALAMGVAHVSAFFTLFKPDRQKIAQLNLFVYRSIQIGVILLAAGTILGGMWANESWGRFWGWDPKEVWALIALLGYLALLHGRYAGWLRGFGLSMGAIFAFMLVMMAWYGVNFVLGAGLHSYGFSSGGYMGMMIYLILEIILVSVAIYKHRKIA